jgi:hypothetical protein
VAFSLLLLLLLLLLHPALPFLPCPLQPVRMHFSCLLLICPLLIAVRLLGLKKSATPSCLYPMGALRGGLGGFTGLSPFILKIN